MVRQGDKCWVRLNKKHYGVCTGHDTDGEPWFVHNTREGGVVHTTRKGFAGNRPIEVEQRATPGHESAVATRALTYVGRQYDMLFFNCEHLANLVVNGEAESKQVQQGLLWTAVATAFLAVVANENGTSVDGGGYRRNGGGQFASRRWW
jgi:hypothetical protein